MDGDKLIIEITEGQELSSLEIIKKNGEKEFKTVALYDLLDSIRREIPISTELLPPGTRIFGGSEGNFGVIIEQPAIEYTINVNTYDQYKPKAIKVPIPASLFAFKIIDSNIIQSDVVSFIPPLLDESKELYFFPYGNANSTICWGTVKPGKIKSVSETYSSIVKFMDSSFNGDLWYSNYRKNNSFYNFVEEMSTLKEFPKEYLCPTTKTFSNFKRGFFK